METAPIKLLIKIIKIVLDYVPAAKFPASPFSSTK